MANKKVRFGIVGSAPPGSWQATAHMPALLALPDVEVSAICTTRMESANEGAKRFNIPYAFADVNEMARHPDVDAVSVVVKVPEHFKPVMAAIDAGKHVICEWPLGASTEQAIEMRDAAKRKGVLHGIGLQARVSESVNFLKDLIADGYVGRVISCTMVSSRQNYGGEVAQNKAWALDKKWGYSSLMNGHTIDAVRYCLGEFAEVSAMLGVSFPETRVRETGEIVPKTSPDQVLVSGRLQSGAYVSVHQRDGTFSASGLLFEINGSDGDIVLTSPASVGVQFAAPLIRGARRGPDGARQPLAELTIPAKYRWVPDSVPAGNPLNVAQEYAQLANAIRDGKKSVLPDFDVAVGLHHALDAIQRAADTGQRVTL